MKWLRKLFAPKPKRVELRCVPWGDAADLLDDGWTIAPEEDHNQRLGFVYLERLCDRVANG